jgi:hypothetical protein
MKVPNISLKSNNSLGAMMPVPRREYYTVDSRTVMQKIRNK